MASKMTLVWVLIGLVLFAAGGWLFVIVMAARRAVQSVNTAPQEQQLKAQEDDLLKRVQEQADKDKQEVKNASGDDLRKLGVRRLFRIVK